MASFIVDNNVESTVADNPLAQAATTLNVANGEGVNFPSTFPFRLTIWDEDTYPDPGDDSGMEIVECTARSTDALTISRGKEGTGDVAHANGERVAILITAGLFNDATYGIVTKLDGIESGATADQTGAEIKTAYEGEADTNAFTDIKDDVLSDIDASVARQFSSSGVVTTTSATYVTAKTATLSNPPDTLVITWKNNSNGGTAYTQIQRDGGDVGNEHTDSGSYPVYSEMSEEIAGWSNGDVLTLIHKVSGGYTSRTKDFLIKGYDAPTTLAS